MSTIAIVFWAWIILDVGIVMGWCLRVGLTRAQAGVTRPKVSGGFIRSLN